MATSARSSAIRNAITRGAIACFRKCIDLEPKDPQAHYNLSAALYCKGDLDEAIREYHTAINLDPKYVSHANIAGLALRDKGQAAARAGQWDKAAPAIAQWCQLQPSDHWSWFLNAPLLVQMGDLCGYRRACGKMLARFGKTNDAAVAERTAKTCLLAPDAVRDFDAVQKLADLAVQKNASDRWIQLTKALAEYRSGRYAKAIERLQRLAPKTNGASLDATALAVLAMARKRQGQAQEACTALEQTRIILAQKLPKHDKAQRFGDDWHDWLRCQILCREAESLLATEGKNTQRNGTKETKKKQ